MENRNLRANLHYCSRCLVGNKPEVKNSSPKIGIVRMLLPAQQWARFSFHPDCGQILRYFWTLVLERRYKNRSNEFLKLYLRIPNVWSSYCYLWWKWLYFEKCRNVKEVHKSVWKLKLLSYICTKLLELLFSPVTYAFYNLYVVFMRLNNPLNYL